MKSPSTSGGEHRVILAEAYQAFRLTIHAQLRGKVVKCSRLSGNRELIEKPGSVLSLRHPASELTKLTFLEASRASRGSIDERIIVVIHPFRSDYPGEPFRGNFRRRLHSKATGIKSRISTQKIHKCA